MKDTWVFEAVPMTVEIWILAGSVNFSPMVAESDEKSQFWAVYRRLNGTGPAEHCADYHDKDDAQTVAYEANRRNQK